jgi:hypothetical protein
VKNTAASPYAPLRDRDSLEARLGLRVGALLSERAAQAPHDIEARLRFAREQALATARHVRKLQAASTTQVLTNGRSRTAVLNATPRWLVGLGSVVPVLLLIAGLALIDEWHDRAQIVAAADVDSALLADDLPPNAYSDAGFVEFLRNQQR